MVTLAAVVIGVLAVVSTCGATIVGAWLLLVDAMSMEFGWAVVVEDGRRKLHLRFSLGGVGWVVTGDDGLFWVAIGG
ncbi:hypothetical protein HanIR_Chr03g0100861 [Helianthus annuus]|nr:hypothetical protein HanIR_Chr03g0100861 [Helianthus annuus]